MKDYSYANQTPFIPHSLNETPPSPYAESMSSMDYPQFPVYAKQNVYPRTYSVDSREAREQTLTYISNLYLPTGHNYAATSADQQSVSSPGRDASIPISPRTSDGPPANKRLKTHHGLDLLPIRASHHPSKKEQKRRPGKPPFSWTNNTRRELLTTYLKTATPLKVIHVTLARSGFNPW